MRHSSELEFVIGDILMPETNSFRLPPFNKLILMTLVDRYVTLA